MKQSEIVLLSLCALAVGYGVYEFALKPGKTGKTPPTAAKKEEISTLVTSINAVTAGSGYNQRQIAAMLHAVNSPPNRDPFLYRSFTVGDGGKGAKDESIVPLAEDKYVYSSFLGAGEQRIAIINGLDYVKGDRIDDYILDEISPDAVIFRQNNKLFKLAIKEEANE